MPVYTAATRVIAGGSEVTAVRLSAFAVIDPGEDAELLEDELALATRVLDDINDLLGDARLDEHHRHHHWWVNE